MRIRIFRALLATALAISFFYFNVARTIKAQTVTITVPISAPACSSTATAWTDAPPAFLMKYYDPATTPAFLTLQANTKAAFQTFVTNCATHTVQYNAAVPTKNQANITAAFQAASVDNAQQANQFDAFAAAALELMPGQNVSGVAPVVATSYAPATSFAKGSVLHFNGIIYIANAVTATTDVPGTAPTWTALIWGPKMRANINNDGL